MELERKFNIQDINKVMSRNLEDSEEKVYIYNVCEYYNKLIIMTNKGIYYKENNSTLKEFKFDGREMKSFEQCQSDIVKNKDGSAYIVVSKDDGQTNYVIHLFDKEFKNSLNDFKGYKRLSKSENVDNNKEWIISLSKAVKNDIGMLKKCVKILDDYGNEVNYEIQFENGGGKIHIKPVEKYKNGQTYHIVIDKNIKSFDEEIFDQSVEKEFTIKN